MFRSLAGEPGPWNQKKQHCSFSRGYLKLPDSRRGGAWSWSLRLFEQLGSWRLSADQVSCCTAITACQGRVAWARWFSWLRALFEGPWKNRETKRRPQILVQIWAGPPFGNKPVLETNHSGFQFIFVAPGLSDVFIALVTIACRCVFGTCVCLTSWNGVAGQHQPDFLIAEVSILLRAGIFAFGLQTSGSGFSDSFLRCSCGSWRRISRLVSRCYVSMENPKNVVRFSFGFPLKPNKGSLTVYMLRHDLDGCPSGCLPRFSSFAYLCQKCHRLSQNAPIRQLLLATRFDFGLW